MALLSTPLTRTSIHRRLAVIGVGLTVLLGGCVAPGDDTPDVAGTDASIDGPTDAPTATSEPTLTPAAADCSAQGAEASAAADDDLPAEVAALRDTLVDAARRCDEQALRTAIDASEMFTYSFGGDGDAIAYWRELEEAGQEPYLRLVQVLGTTPAVADGGGIVVWPQVTTGRPEDTTQTAWEELHWLSAEELAASRGETGYLGWRVGISMDGQWRFFVAGD